jgi:hypothetical protein
MKTINEILKTHQSVNGKKIEEGCGRDVTGDVNLPWVNFGSCFV